MNLKISELSLGLADLDAVVPATNSAGTATEKVRLGDIVDLGRTPRVVNLSYSSTVETDASEGDLFNLTLTGGVTLANPTNGVDGQTIRWRITQDATGNRSVTLGDKFVVPSSATSPLPFSTLANKMDILAATYHEGRDKWDVIAFVMGY